MSATAEIGVASTDRARLARTVVAGGTADPEEAKTPQDLIESTVTPAIGSPISPRGFQGFGPSETRQFSNFQAHGVGPRTGPRCRSPPKSKTLKSPPIAHFSEFSLRAIFSMAPAGAEPCAAVFAARLGRSAGRGHRKNCGAADPAPSRLLFLPGLQRPPETKRLGSRFDDVRPIRQAVQKGLAQSGIRKHLGPL